VVLRIIRTPQRSDAVVEFSINGDVLTVNGSSFDFSNVPEGGYVESVPCQWIVGPVRREGGDIHITIIETYRPEVADVEA